MKNSTLPILLCVVLGYSSTAQKFTLLPQIGHEASKTFLTYNNLASFMPKDKQLAPSLGVRLDYSFKQGGGPYLGIATSRSSVAINFSDPESGMNISNVSTGKMQLRVEGGYQVSTKPIYFNKSKAATSKPAVSSLSPSSVRSRCGGYCSRFQSMHTPSVSNSVAPESKGWSFSIQPSVGMAFVPAVKTDVSTQVQGSKTSVSYVAGNWSSAATAGVGFEFDNNLERKFIVSVQYLKGIGNLNARTITTASGSKNSVNTINSSVSVLNVSVGIPINLIKKKTVVKQQPIKQEKKPVEENKIKTQHRCRQYHSSYMRSI